MNPTASSRDASTQAIEVFEPRPGELYDLGTTAALAGVSRRTLMRYCRLGLVCPVVLPPFGMVAFDDDAIYLVRRTEHARVFHGVDLTLLRTFFELLAEVDALRAELRFARRH